MTLPRIRSLPVVVLRSLNRVMRTCTRHVATIYWSQTRQALFTSARLLSGLAAVLTIHSTVGTTSPVTLSPDAEAALTFVFDGELLGRDNALLSDEADSPTVTTANVRHRRGRYPTTLTIWLTAFVNDSCTEISPWFRAAASILIAFFASTPI